MPQGGATALGLAAVLMWSSLTGLSVGLAAVPPFELMAVTFLIGGLVGLGFTASRGRLALLRVPWPVWMLGVGAIFGDYALFFTAIRLAPAAQASLLSYLWPLFAVLFSALLMKERWHARHLAGAALGLAAVLVMAADVGGPAPSPEAWRGYGLALASGLVWAGYSTVSRRLSAVPSEATYGFCLCVAALAAATHVLSESTVGLRGAGQWVWLAVIGVGPAGLAFAAWDFGIKRGDMRTLTVTSYAIPVLSTLVLVACNIAPLTTSLAVACVLIAVAAVMAAPGRSALTGPDAP